MNISVVIPLYNKAQSISKTIDCVLTQSYKNFEVVVVNDGSTDGSESVVAAYTDERIRLINKENGGVSSARNEGIRQAKYQYIALLDADDYWDHAYLEEQTKMITDFPDAKMWGMGWGYINDDKTCPHDVHFVGEPNFRGYVSNFWIKPKKSNIFWSSSVVINKIVFDDINMFDERLAYSEDLDVWWRIILNFSVAFNSNILAYYREDAENRAMNKVMPIEKFLPYYIEEFPNYRKNNKDFRVFFDRFCISGIYPYMVKDECSEDTKRILSQITLKEQKFSVRFRMKFPKTFNWIVSLLKK